MHIRIISPAGSIKPRLIEQGAETLRSWGHQVSLAPHAADTYGRFSASPADRADDIVAALRDPDVDVLWASRGGYGCVHLLDRIPVDLIREASKPVVGYSDVTALHALWQRAGVACLHAPMMKHLASEPGHRTTKTLRELLDYYAAHHGWPPRHNLLFGRMATLQPNLEHDADVLLSPWVGGNLSVLTGLHGSPFDFDYAGRVLFVEDVGEAPYRIDRMMQQLHIMGVLGQVRALVCGRFTATEEDPLMPLHIWDNLRTIGEEHGLPVWMGAPIGHVTLNYPVVVGAHADF